MARRLVLFVAAAAALLAPALVEAGKSHGGSGGSWRVPVAENKAWKKYK